MDSIELINIIKKMLADNLTTSAREQLLDEKPMINFQSQQWKKAPKAHIQDNVVSQNILNKIMVKCRSEKQPILKNRKYYHIGYSIAATVALFIVGFWIVNNVSSSYINISAPVDDKLAITLPDSSEVWLNAASQIRYHKSFLNNREIFLEKGEAFFKVKKAQGAPFRVYFRESRIEVTGTEFNIKAGHMESEITLFTGSIKFQAEEGQRELPMQPNERIVYNTQAKSVVRTNIDINEYDWRSSKYRFTNKPLQEFIDFINRSYHVNIIIKEEKLKELKFNGTIRKDEPLTNIIEKICISLDLKEKQEKNNIILKHSISLV